MDACFVTACLHQWVSGPYTRLYQKLKNLGNQYYLHFCVSDSKHEIKVVLGIDKKCECNVLKKLLGWDMFLFGFLFSTLARDIAMLYFWSWNWIPAELNDVLFIAIWCMLIESHKYISASVNTIGMSDFWYFCRAGHVTWLWWHTWNLSPGIFSDGAHKCLCTVLRGLHRVFCKKKSLLQTKAKWDYFMLFFEIATSAQLYPTGGFMPNIIFDRTMVKVRWSKCSLHC